MIRKSSMVRIVAQAIIGAALMAAMQVSPATAQTPDSADRTPQPYAPSMARPEQGPYRPDVRTPQPYVPAPYMPTRERQPLGNPADTAQTPQKDASVFREVPATLENASNAKLLTGSGDEKGVYSLTKEQKAYLNANKFLLIPLEDADSGLYNWDDMLSTIDAIGGNSDAHYRSAANTKLITPDIVLHAYHRLFDNTLEHLEMTELSRDLDMALVGLVRSIQEERRIATQNAKPELAARLERIEAQMTIPLILLESAPQAKKSDSGDDSASPERFGENDRPDVSQGSSSNSSVLNAPGTSAPANATVEAANNSSPSNGSASLTENERENAALEFAGHLDQLYPRGGNATANVAVEAANTSGQPAAPGQGAQANASAPSVAGKNASATPVNATELFPVSESAAVAPVEQENASASPAAGENASTPSAAGPHDSSPPDPEKAAALAKLETLAGRFSPGTLASMRQELENIFAAKGRVDAAPLFTAYISNDPEDHSARRDYTLFAPRGHYNKTSRSRAYFRAMSYMGSSLWPLANDKGLGDALLITLLLGRKGPGGQPVLDLFNRILTVTSLFAGKPDDPGYAEMSRLLSRTFGDRQLTLEDALDPAVHAKIAANITRADTPRIRGASGATPGFRLLGQRFTQDGFILTSLFGYRTDEVPYAASALFVMAALGDKTARDFALEHVKRMLQDAPKPVMDDLAAQLDKLTDKIDKWPASTWRESLAAGWLAVLRTLGGKRSETYPAYMRSAPFAVKELQASLGSYTELKHDTILYGKQSFAEMGEGGEEKLPPVPKGFVEPNEAFWKAMTELVAITRQGLDAHAGSGLSGASRTPPRQDQEDESYAHQRSALSLWSHFDSDIHFLAGLARKESANERISDKE